MLNIERCLPIDATENGTSLSTKVHNELIKKP